MRLLRNGITPTLLAVYAISACGVAGGPSGPVDPPDGNPPALTRVTPAASDQSLATGESLTFVVEARAADGHTVEVEYLVDGSARATGTQFTFTPTGPGRYRIEVVASDGERTARYTWTVTVAPRANTPPTAVLALDPATGSAPLPVRVRLSGGDPDGSVVRYRITLAGDAPLVLDRGAPIDTVLVLAEGTWAVTGTVEDNSGASTQSSATAIVTTPRVNQTPTPQLSVTPQSGEAPLVVVVEGRGTDPDGTIALYALDLDGDGQVEIDATTPLVQTVRFTAAGDYWVRLQVIDDDRAAVWDSVLVTVTAPPGPPPPPPPPPPGENAAPTLTLTASPSEGEAPVKVRARVEGRDSDGRVTALALDFTGDGTSDETTGQNTLEANWTYGVPGTYVIRATVTDDRGATTSATATITVRAAPNEAPTGSLAVNTTSGDAPVRVHLQAEGSDADGQIVKWELDDDRGTDGFVEFTPAQGVDVEYAFRDSPYRPRLRVTDNRGAATTVTGPAITVYRPVSASRSLTSSTGNPRFEGLSIAPAVWADGQDRLRFTISVRDAAGKPVAGVPLRVRSLRPDLVAPDGTDLGGTVTIALDGTVTDGAGQLTGALTTTTSSRVFAVPSPGVLVPFDLKVEADVGHDTWRRLPDVTRLNAETVVSGTVGDGQFFVKPQGVTCVGQTVEIHVRGMRRGDAPSPGGPAAGRFTEVRYSQSGAPLTGIIPLPGYEEWRTDGNGFMKFRYTPTAPDFKTLKAWVDGQPITIDTALAVEQC